MTKKGSTKIVNVISPGSEVFGHDHYLTHLVNMYYFFKNLFLVLHPCIDQMKWIYINDGQEMVYKNCNILTTGTKVLVIGHGHITYVVISSALILFFKTSSLHMYIDKINWVFCNHEHGMVYQNCKFNDPGDMGSFAMAWPWQNGKNGKNELFL